jgi:hypothetical protein
MKKGGDIQSISIRAASNGWIVDVAYYFGLFDTERSGQFVFTHINLLKEWLNDHVEKVVK